MPSFDAVSELDTHELTNAVDQANRELSQRFDFKDTGAVFELKEKEMTVSLKAPAEFQLMYLHTRTSNRENAMRISRDSDGSPRARPASTISARSSRCPTRAERRTSTFR